MIKVPELDQLEHPQHHTDGTCGSPNPLLRFVGHDDAAEEDVVQQALEVLVSKHLSAWKNGYHILRKLLFLATTGSQSECTAVQN
jgi:hypothetical protein